MAEMIRLRIVWLLSGTMAGIVGVPNTETMKFGENMYRRCTRFLVPIWVGTLLLMAPGCDSGEPDGGEDGNEAVESASVGEQEEASGGVASEETAQNEEFQPVEQAWWTQETIGELQITLRDEEVIDVLGEPTESTPPTRRAVDGFYVNQWQYPDRGITIELGASEKMELRSVISIEIKEPADLETERGIGLGSSREEVEAQYGDEIDEEMSDDGEIVAGSIYGGIIFKLEDDVVREIFVGATAE